MRQRGSNIALLSSNIARNLPSKYIMEGMFLGNGSFDFGSEYGNSEAWKEYEKEYECLVSAYINESDECKKNELCKKPMKGLVLYRLYDDLYSVSVSQGFNGEGKESNNSDHYWPPEAVSDARRILDQVFDQMLKNQI